MNLVGMRQRIRDLEELVLRADSMLSYIRHRGPQGWQQATSFDLSAQEVDDLIGALRRGLSPEARSDFEATPASSVGPEASTQP